MPVTFETVRRIGTKLPEVEEATTFGAPALKLRGPAPGLHLQQQGRRVRLVHLPGREKRSCLRNRADDLRAYVNQDQPDIFRPREAALTGGSWGFPAASVSAVELEVA